MNTIDNALAFYNSNHEDNHRDIEDVRGYVAWKSEFNIPEIYAKWFQYEEFALNHWEHGDYEIVVYVNEKSAGSGETSRSGFMTLTDYCEDQPAEFFKDVLMSKTMEDRIYILTVA